MGSFSLESRLGIEAPAFWATVSMDSVNRELAPLVRMTAPEDWHRCPLERWETGRELFRSWILLFGVLPVDRHAFLLESVTPGVGFEERSSSWMNREWRHRRSVRANGDGTCIVRDDVTVLGRFPLLTSITMPLYRLVFRNRHRRMRALFPEEPHRGRPRR